VAERIRSKSGESTSNLDHIVKAGKQLGELIDSTRAMFGKASAEQDLVDVRLLVSNVLALARSELGSHQIVLRDEMGEGLPEVTASRVQLQQVILNLIMNAVEAMSSVTGRERRLTIGSSLNQPGTLTITVDDRESELILLISTAFLIPSLLPKPTGWA
jgi:C4-dicarboxylate-specific signal transduction histidine kinase